MHSSLKSVLCAALCVAAGVGVARADETLRKAQQALRDQGFYYGTIDGSPGDETTQALRRYQIRNGLPVTGALDEATQKSIAKTGGASGSAGSTRPRITPKPDDNDRRYAGASPESTPSPLAPQPPTIRGDDEEVAPPPRRPAPRPDLRLDPVPAPQQTVPPELDDQDGSRRLPNGSFRPSASLTNMLIGTPFEFAPPPVQSDVLRRAQISLLRSGFYGGDPDGVPGPGTSDALAEFQSANRLHRTGRLDTDTLAALRLLPGPKISPVVRRPYPQVYEGRIVR